MEKKYEPNRKLVVQSCMDEKTISALDDFALARSMTRSSFVHHIAKIWLAEQEKPKAAQAMNDFAATPSV